MSDGERLQAILEQQRQDEAAARPRRTLPKGTEPTVDMDARTGRGTVAGNFLAGEDRDWDAVLEFLGYDPELYEVDDRHPIQVRAWDGQTAAGVQRMQYAKATLRLRSDSLDADELVKHIRKRKPPRRLAKAQPETGWTDVVCLSDWQIGKAHEAGGGTPETIERVVDMVGRAQDRHRERRKLKRGAYKLILPGMGDLTERCAGHYPNQTYTTDTNEREQARIARWLLTKVVTELAPLYTEVILTAVASNHGQNRQNGKGYTTDDDDSDLTVFESVHEALRMNPDAYGHVHRHESPDPLVATLDVDGTGVAFIHGHKVRGTSKPIYGMWSWWDGQMAGRLPAGDCTTLVGAHWHHPYSLAQQGRTLLGCPALDGGSRWLTDASGVWSDPGTLAFSLHAGTPTPQAVELL